MQEVTHRMRLLIISRLKLYIKNKITRLRKYPSLKDDKRKKEPPGEGGGAD